MWGHDGEGDRSVGGRDLRCTSLSSIHNRLLPPSPPTVLGARLESFGGLRSLKPPPNDDRERAGLGSRVEARLENLGRDGGLSGEVDFVIKRLAIPERDAGGLGKGVRLEPASEISSRSGLVALIVLRGNAGVLEVGEAGVGLTRDC